MKKYQTDMLPQDERTSIEGLIKRKLNNSYDQLGEETIQLNQVELQMNQENE